MKNSKGHGSEKGNRGRPALTPHEKYLKRKDGSLKTWREKHKNKLATQQARINVRWRHCSPARYLWLSAKGSAKRGGRIFNIQPQDLEPLPKFCSVLGLRLRYRTTAGGGRGARHAATPSVDRIDNSLGYVRGNVCVISWRANKLKSNATPEELRALARYASP